MSCSCFSHAGRRLSGCAIGIALLAAAPMASAGLITGSAAVTSDYVWRGSSQSQGRAAIQAGVKAAAGSGAYASLWASSVDFGATVDASTELDGVLGWAGALTPEWALDVSFIRYHYPGSSDGRDWNELGATVSWKQDCWLQLGVADDALASDRPGTYVQFGVRLPLNDALRFEAAAGHYFLAGAYADDYTDAQLSAVWAFASPLELRISGHVTDASARRLFPGQAGWRLEAALQATF